MSLIIRIANPDDNEIIFDFICQLAEYEKLREEVSATPETLRKSLFENKEAEVLIAEEDGFPVGFALFFHNFSTFKGKACLYLEDIYVREELRGKGFGKALFMELVKIAQERGCERFDWSVLKWNKPSIGFYRSLGAEEMSEWRTYRLTKEKYKNLLK